MAGGGQRAGSWPPQRPHRHRLAPPPSWRRRGDLSRRCHDERWRRSSCWRGGPTGGDVLPCLSARPCRERHRPRRTTCGRPLSARGWRVDSRRHRRAASDRRRRRRRYATTRISRRRRVTTHPSIHAKSHPTIGMRQGGCHPSGRRGGDGGGLPCHASHYPRAYTAPASTAPTCHRQAIQRGRPAARRQRSCAATGGLHGARRAPAEHVQRRRPAESAAAAATTPAMVSDSAAVPTTISSSAVPTPVAVAVRTPALQPPSSLSLRTGGHRPAPAPTAQADRAATAASPPSTAIFVPSAAAAAASLSVAAGV